MKILLLKLILLGTVLLTFLIPQPTYGINDGSRYATESKLSSGKWIKLKVSDNAIYKLTYEDIKSMGIDDPSKVNVYGYGGWMIDVDFNQPYVDDLPEVSCWVNKGSDGQFGPGDFLLFYGRGTTKWAYNASGNEFVHEQNAYATYGCYFLTQGERGPKEMSESASVVGTTRLSKFDDYDVYEEDVTHAPDFHSGRELFGGTSFLTKSNQSFSGKLKNMPGITVDPAQVTLSFAVNVSRISSVSLSMDNEVLMERNIPITNTISYVKGELYNYTANWIGEKPEKINPTVQFNASSSTATFASLNYIRINAVRELKYYGDGYTFFRNRENVDKSVVYDIKNASGGLMVFDVTGNYDSHIVKAALQGNVLSFGSQSGEAPREYALVDPAKSFPKPELIGDVKNQNLHALPQTEMVVISPKLFMNYADAYAELHRKRDNMNITVVQSDDIFNEFSSGVPDASAYRRFLKMFYDRGTTDKDRPKYLLLFGDGIYDNRFLTEDCRSLNRDAFLLTYQVKASLDERISYGTDDYFGFLDDRQGPGGTEGSDLAGSLLCVGIGRFPVRTTDEAKSTLEKLVTYMDNRNAGSWTNSICFSADDTDNKDISISFCNHAREADELAEYMEDNHPEYVISKIYMDAYKQTLTNGKVTYPDVNSKLNNALKNGCLLYNYTGHGSTTSLSSEHMVNMNDIYQMTFPNLPLWITATCDFSWFDGVSSSAGEAVFMNKKSAGIALYSTTRVVYSDQNLLINKQLIEHLFSKTEDGTYPRLGDVLKKGKNALTLANKLNYILLGDPALRLNYPESKVELQTINGVPVEGQEFSFKALEKVTLSGVIRDPSGNIDADFNGLLQTNIYDSEQTIHTVVKNSGGGTFDFTDYPNLAYMGKDSVKNGSFSFTFMVPLDISYTDNNGKMNFYASDKSGNNEASGSFLKYKLTGTSDTLVTDTVGPEIISMYLNAPDFTNGEAVNPTPYFYAEVYDENGVNMSGSSLGHDITISIDNSPSMTYNLNQYYTPSPGNSGGGTIMFSIPELPAGYHKLYFRVWDLLNNSSLDSLEFYVDPGLKPRIFDLIALKNPAREFTYFSLTHDRPETKVSVEIFVYDFTGRRVWNYQNNNLTTGWEEPCLIEWDLNSDNGSKVNPGVYIYKAAIRTSTSQETTEAKKIIILGQ